MLMQANSSNLIMHPSNMRHRFSWLLWKWLWVLYLASWRMERSWVRYYCTKSRQWRKKRKLSKLGNQLINCLWESFTMHRSVLLLKSISCYPNRSPDKKILHHNGHSMIILCFLLFDFIIESWIVTISFSLTW